MPSVSSVHAQVGSISRAGALKQVLTLERIGEGESSLAMALRTRKASSVSINSSLSRDSKGVVRYQML